MADYKLKLGKVEAENSRNFRLFIIAHCQLFYESLFAVDIIVIIIIISVVIMIIIIIMVVQVCQSVARGE